MPKQFKPRPMSVQERNAARKWLKDHGHRPQDVDPKDWNDVDGYVDVILSLHKRDKAGTPCRRGDLE